MISALSALWSVVKAVRYLMPFLNEASKNYDPNDIADRVATDNIKRAMRTFIWYVFIGGAGILFMTFYVIPLHGRVKVMEYKFDEEHKERLYLEEKISELNKISEQRNANIAQLQFQLNQSQTQVKHAMENFVECKDQNAQYRALLANVGQSDITLTTDPLGPSNFDKDKSERTNITTPSTGNILIVPDTQEVKKLLAMNSTNTSKTSRNTTTKSVKSREVKVESSHSRTPPTPNRDKRNDSMIAESRRGDRQNLGDTPNGYDPNRDRQGNPNPPNQPDQPTRREADRLTANPKDRNQNPGFNATNRTSRDKGPDRNPRNSQMDNSYTTSRGVEVGDARPESAKEQDRRDEQRSERLNAPQDRMTPSRDQQGPPDSVDRSLSNAGNHRANDDPHGAVSSQQRAERDRSSEPNDRSEHGSRRDQSNQGPNDRQGPEGQSRNGNPSDHGERNDRGPGDRSNDRGGPDSNGRNDHGEGRSGGDHGGRGDNGRGNDGHGGSRGDSNGGRGNDGGRGGDGGHGGGGRGDGGRGGPPR